MAFYTQRIYVSNIKEVTFTLNYTLKNGLTFPATGFGTYKASPESMTLAISQGYRYFDTASIYKTEQALGQAVSSSGLKREDFFITSKVWKTEMGRKNMLEAFSRTLDNLKTDYLDGYMIHWPAGESIDLETWHAMEELYLDGKIRALGLSNFLPHHADYIISNCRVAPAFAQIEFHPGYIQPLTLNYYRERNIIVQAWSPTARGRIFDDVLVKELTAKYSISPVELCIAFCAAEGVMPLVKSSSTERLRQNLEAVNITLEQWDIMRLENMPPAGWSGEHPDRERIPV